MKCHYEVLGVSQDANDQELRAAYRQLALKWHPDKNIQNQQEATENFKLIQVAYELLSDPQERAYYDRNRDRIIKGDLDADREELVDIFPYFSSGCFKGYDDSENAFYAVYRNLFEEIAAEEDQDFPSFGDSQSDYEKDIRQFYQMWESFCTTQGFEWIVKYNPLDAVDRRSHRFVEKENKKLQDAARKERNENIRQLVSFVKKRDPRVRVYMEALKKEQDEKRKIREQKREEQKKEKLQKMEEFQEPEWISFQQLDAELRALEAEHDAIDGDEGGQSDDDALYCSACDKLFMSSRSFENHVRSKKHKQTVERVKQQMAEDDLLYGDDSEYEDLDEDEEAEEQAGNDNDNDKAEPAAAIDEQVDSEDDEAEIKKTRDKKKKKKQAFQARLSESEPEAAAAIPPPAEVRDSDDDDFNRKSTKKDKRKPKKTAKKDDPPIPKQDQQTEQHDDNNSEPVKLKGHKAKEAKRKAKKNTPNNDAAAPSNIDTENHCATCGTEFSSRNKMFDHLKRTGHSRYLGK